MKKSTMNWQDVKAIWDTPVIGKTIRKATKKGFEHKQNPTWKPAKASMTPKQWHKANRKRLQLKKA